MYEQFLKTATLFTTPTDYTGDIPRADITSSKLGGAPYQLEGMEWPEGMMFLAQLRLEEVQDCEGLPKSGLLQFFLPAATDYGLFNSDPKCHVRWIESTDEPSANVQWFDGSELSQETTSPDRYPLDTPGAGTLRPTSKLSPLSSPGFPLPLTVTETVQQLPMGLDEDETVDPDLPDAPEELFSAGGIQIGGYPYFTQSDPREEGSEEILLFQLDSDYPGINLGDAGTMQFFITPADLARRDFSNVSMDWACY
ncbi:YwqG family protein [Corynebacterium sp. H130]|uniref:YwqG family protein n=1 Tax=Corynebacterium sp. H130 TaxID=3133444 RepID=UPI003096712A